MSMNTFVRLKGIFSTLIPACVAQMKDGYTRQLNSTVNCTSSKSFNSLRNHSL